MSTPRDALTAATALVETLRAAGVVGFVVSPGSRSTPLALAVARSDADAWIVLDERSAGFLAVGRASVLGKPVAVVCTSGTATANLLPAIVEASMRRVPLVVLTADRPSELHGVGANQTIPQDGIYGGFVRLAETLETASEAGASDWAAAAVRAVRAALEETPGPVHLNLPFREPFIPASGETASWQANTEPVRSKPVPLSPGDAAWLGDLLARSERPFVYAGGIDEPLDIAPRLKVPFAAEPTSRLPGTSAASLALTLDEVRDALRPDLVVQLGRAPTSRAANGFVASADALVTVDRDGWVHDPNRRAVRTIRASVRETLRHGVLESDAPQEWQGAWQAVAGRAEAVQVMHLDGPLWDGSVARIVSDAVADDGVLVAGSSLPIRDLDLYGSRPRTVVANRGASGIDGLVSTVAGASTAGFPTIGLIGDLSALHDASGLIWLAREHRGTLVVVDNGGGGIFDVLPSRTLPEHERWFRTPHDGRLPRLLHAAGVPVDEPETADELRAALAHDAEAGMRIVHVRIDPAVSAERRDALRADLRRLVLDALP